MAKKYGQAAMEYILVVGFLMLIFMGVLLIIYEKNSEIVQTKVFLDAKKISNSIVTNINTISVQGSGYYRYFTVPEKLYGDNDYEIAIYGNSVELRWGIEPFTWSKSPITANVHGYLVKGENKVINCGGIIYVGRPPISCEAALVNVPPNVTITHPGEGEILNCAKISINGTAFDINGTVMEVEVSIDGGLWWNAKDVVQSSETNWTYSWTPSSDGSHRIRVRATDDYGALSETKIINVNVTGCSDLVPVEPFAPSVNVGTGTNVPVRINVKNNGTGSCGSFQVKFDIINSAGNIIFTNTTQVPSLGAGNTVSVSTNWPVPVTEDNYTVNIIVDSGYTITELNENNNNYSATVKSVTTPPISIITYPDIAALNCTKIIISGTASDDNLVEKVSITITGLGGYSEVSDALLNATGSNVNWNRTWTPPDNDNYLICSRATDNNNRVQYPDYCINVTISGCLVCHIMQVGNVTQDVFKNVEFSIKNNGSYAQTIDKLNVTWNVSASLNKVFIGGTKVWGPDNATSGQVIDIDPDVEITALYTKNVKLYFDADIGGANITVTFILNKSTNCTIILTAPGANETCGNCVDEDGDLKPDWADSDCSQFFIDSNCGEVHYCDSDDSDDDCTNSSGDCGGTCNSPLPPSISVNSTKICNYYGYSTAEWHFYKITPGANGTLSVNFTESGITSGPTDLVIYNSECVRLNRTQDANLKPPTTQTVTAGKTYIIALDVDAYIVAYPCYNLSSYWPAGYNNCTMNGTYTLTTTLIPT